MSSLSTGLYAVLCAVFTISSVSKVRAYPTFVESLRPLRIVPHRLVPHVAVAVTATEVVLAVGFGWAIVMGTGLVPASQGEGLAALVLAGLLLVVLTAGIALAIRRGWEATCVCFGAGSQPLSLRHLLRNGLLIGVVLAGLAVWMLPGGAHTAEVGGELVALGGGVVTALILVRLDDVVDVFTPTRRS